MGNKPTELTFSSVSFCWFIEPYPLLAPDWERGEWPWGDRLPEPGIITGADPFKMPEIFFTKIVNTVEIQKPESVKYRSFSVPVFKFGMIR